MAPLPAACVCPRTGPVTGGPPGLQTWMLWLSRLDCLTAHYGFHRALGSFREELEFLLFGHFSDVTKTIMGINLLSSQLHCEFG